MKKKIRNIIIGIILFMLFVPIPSYAKDGGTVSYKAILWSVTDRHTMWTEDGVSGHIVGYEVRILWFEVYNDTEFVPHEENVNQENIE